MGLIVVVDRGASEGSPRSSSDKVLRGPRSASMVGWVLTVLDSRVWVIDLTEQVGSIAAETTPSLGVVESMTLTVHECPDELE